MRHLNPSTTQWALIGTATVITLGLAGTAYLASRRTKPRSQENLRHLRDHNDVYDWLSQIDKRSFSRGQLLLSGVPSAMSMKVAVDNPSIMVVTASIQDVERAISQYRHEEEPVKIPIGHWAFIGVPIHGSWAYDSESEFVANNELTADGLQALAKWVGTGEQEG